MTASDRGLPGRAGLLVGSSCLSLWTKLAKELVQPSFQDRPAWGVPAPGTHGGTGRVPWRSAEEGGRCRLRCHLILLFTESSRWQGEAPGQGGRATAAGAGTVSAQRCPPCWVLGAGHMAVARSPDHSQVLRQGHRDTGRVTIVPEAPQLTRGGVGTDFTQEVYM